MIGTCRLCQTVSDLQLSHIVPKFVFKWLKETAASPLRHSQKPNVRVQDGEKLYFLCAKCENLFSKWENLFAQNIFYPLQKEQLDNRYIQYGDWCLKFAVSLSWRLLAYGKEKDIDQISSEQSSRIDEALETWREYLLSVRKSPAPFDQQLFPLSIIESHADMELSPFINRYFLRAVDVDIAHSSTRLFTYIKMGKIMLIGLVQENQPKLWKNGKIWANRGLIEIGVNYGMPSGLGEYINARSDKTANIFHLMSENQQQKVINYTDANKEKILQSEIFIAMKQDFELFGDDAVTR